MAEIRPFAAYRPAGGLERRIAALPYDVYSRGEAKKEVERNPESFLAIDRAETGFEDSVDTCAPEVYERAAGLLEEWIRRGRFVQDEKPCYYLYEQIMEGRSQTGIVACASVDDYVNQVVKKHENTREEKELDRIRHVDACNMQTGPIFLAYRKNEVLQKIIASVKEGKPECEFTSDDQIVHRVWVIDDGERISAVYEAFRQVPAVYIADGHHRCASAVKVGLRRRKENPANTGEEAYNYFLAVLFQDEELCILDYNRVLKDLVGMGVEELLRKLEADFTVEKLICSKEGTSDIRRPAKKGEFSLYLDGSWYRLRAKPHCFSEDPVENLDVSILQTRVLAPFFGIEDPKTDKRIDFVGGIRGLDELERRCGEDCRAAFALYPTDIRELFAVADAGRLMPPKSTWFEPKLRSGIFIHML